MPTINFAYSKIDLIRLVEQDLARRFPDAGDHYDVVIETRSTQNYKSTWEAADYRATGTITE